MPSEADIARLAHAQHGNVAFTQLGGLGFTPDAIRHRAVSGRLVRRYRGVYAWGYLRTDFLSRASAARLAAGTRSCLAGTAAAAVYRALPEPSGPIHLTRPTRADERHGMVVHEVRLDPAEVWWRQNLPMTSPARTLLDLAESESERTLTRAFNEFQILKLLTRSQLERALPRFDGRRGVSSLRGLLGEDLGATRSVLEDLFVPLMQQANLPCPSLNAAVLGLEVDALWPAERVIVELDGRRFHDTDPRFESDRARDAQLVARGYVVLRFTHRRLKREPFAVIAELAAALSQRSPIAA
ncbi:MAG: DUF559 domain-containing protein [Solirubrobacteraceae bacterium]